MYDTEAHSVFFTDSNQLATYLSSSYGVSITSEELATFGVHFGGTFGQSVSANAGLDLMDKAQASAAKKKTAQEQQKLEKQSMLSMFEINVIRYALYIDNIRSEDLDPFFLVDFMSLPESYYAGWDAYLKYEKFLFRYGTHYIHSAEVCLVSYLFLFRLYTPYL